MVRQAQKEGQAKAASPEVARVASSIKKSDAKDFASTKHKGLPEKKKMNEEGYDHYRDNILMKGGDHRSKETKNKSYTPSKPIKGKTAAQKAAKGKSALDIVKANIRKQYGKGAIMGEDVNCSDRKEMAAQHKAVHNKKKDETGGMPATVTAKNRRGQMQGVDEAKVDKGRSDYGKASIRNYRRSGPGHDDPGMFDPEGKRGKTIEKRRAEHKSRRGVKGAKVPAYKTEEKETALDRAKRNIGRDPDKKTCWTGYKAKGTKMKGGKSVPNCVKEEEVIKEVSKKTLGSYIKKASTEIGTSAIKGDYKKMQKRHKGVLDASDKIQKEEYACSSDSPIKVTKKKKKKEVKEGVMGMIKRVAKVKAKKTTGRDAGAIAAKIMRDKEQKKYVGFLSANEETLVETPKGDAGKDTPTKQSDRAARSYGSGYGAKYNAPARKTIHKMKRGVKKYKGEKENNDGSTKMTNYIDDRKSHFHRQGKSYAEPSRKKVKEEVAISEKIKYDKKGSSMDYFLGKDPKKTEYYKKNAKKKNESKSSCECKHESFAKFLEEGNATGRMLQKSKTQVTGHISADRGSDEKKNQSKRKGLEKDLKKHKIGHKKGVGEYKYDSGETGREVSYQTSKPDKMSKRRFGKVMRRLGRKHGQESVITKDKDKPAKLHTTEKGSKEKSQTLGKSKAGKHPKGYGETSGTKVRSAKLPKKTNKSSYHYG